MIQADRQNIERWLQRARYEQRIAMIGRIALRRLPEIADNQNPFVKVQLLGVLRTALTAVVAARFQSASIKDAARRAAHASDDADAEGSDRSRNAALIVNWAALAAVDEEDQHRYSIRPIKLLNNAEEKIAGQDMSFLRTARLPYEVFSEPLWNGEDALDKTISAYKALSFLWAGNYSTWSFWSRWYHYLRVGKPLPWDFQHAVALLPDEDWDGGPDRVAERIREIEFDFRTRIDRQVVYDEEAKVLRLETDPTPPSDSLSFACKRVTLALDNALASGPANGLKEDSYETLTIRSAVIQHPDDASVIAVSFYDACMSFQRRIGETYPEDTSLINLKNALWTTVEEITELDERAKSRVQQYVQLGMSPPLTPDEKDVLPKMIEEVKPFVDEELDARLRETGELLRTAPEPPRSARARFANWMTTIVTWVDRTRKGEGRMTWLVKQIERMRQWFPGDNGPPEV
ncbi:MAG: hypothetical protein AAFQ79_04645 [Pseudomonadota bacterium]